MSVSSSPSPAVEQTDKRAGESLLRDGEPDWDAISFEVGCSRCGYNLRMLPQPRCPECGLEFNWRDVLDPSAWPSKFLFEHHWRNHFFRSWLKTTWAGLRPFRFWRNVSIHDRIHPGPLWFLLLTSVLWFGITLNGVASLAELALDTALQVANPGFITPKQEPLYRALQVVSQLVFDLRRPRYDLQWPCILLVSLLATLATLCCLRQTLGRRRVRVVQILRVVAYSSTPAYVYLGVVVVAVAALSSPFDSPATPPVLGTCVVICIAASMLACPIVFLTAGLKRYLQLPRAALLAAAAVLVGVLFAATAFMFVITLDLG